MDFEITTNLDTIRNQSITANFAAVDEWLTEELKPYNTMAVTEDMIPAAKTYRANLRKVKDRIEDYRKEAKKAALAPYAAFEEKAKVLTGKIDAAVLNLDTQVKNFEAQEKAAKMERLRTFYDGLNTEAKDYCEWEHIKNPKWENKGFSEDDAKSEIMEALSAAETDIETIRGMGGEDTAYLLDFYKQTHNLPAVIRKAADLAAMRQREEQRQQEAAAKKAEAENAKQKSYVSYAPAVTTDLEQDDIITVDFRVRCTRRQLKGLGTFMKVNGIKYGQIK